MDTASSVRHSPSSCQHTGSEWLLLKPRGWLESCFPLEGRCISGPLLAGTGAHSLQDRLEVLIQGLCWHPIQRSTAGQTRLEVVVQAKCPPGDWILPTEGAKMSHRSRTPSTGPYQGCHGCCPQFPTHHGSSGDIGTKLKHCCHQQGDLNFSTQPRQGMQRATNLAASTVLEKG